MMFSKAWCSWRPSEIRLKLVSWWRNNTGEMWAAAVTYVYRMTQRKMLTKVKLCDKALRTGAGGMPMVDAIMAYFEFSEELSFRD